MTATLSIEAISIAVQTFLLICAADLFSGVFHWAEDTWGTAHTPIWGPIFVRPNLIHHSEPGAMMRKHWLPNNGILFSFAAIIVGIAWLYDSLTWQLVVFAVAGGLSQQAHRFAHSPTVRLPPVIRILQRAHVLQDGWHHFKHHKWPHDCNYCTLTPWVNPVLGKIGFWRGLERLLIPLLGPVRVEAELH